MTKIGIDSRLINKRRGIGNVCYNLLDQLTQINSDFQFIAYIDSQNIPEDLQNIKKIAFSTLKPSFYPFWEQISLPIAAKRDNVALLHSIANTFPLFIAKNIKHIASINDVMFLLPASQMPNSPSAYQMLGRIYSNFVVRTGFSRLDKIITISEYSKEDIIRHLNAKKNLIKPILLGADLARTSSSDLSEKNFNINTPYFFALGARDPRKNTALIIQSFFELKKQYSNPISLVISGLDLAGINFFSSLVQSLNIQNHVHLLGFVSRQELEFLYAKAVGFLYPTLYEGFGLPLLEAMAHAVPVISSNTTAIPEVAGDAAILINPTDKNELLSAMSQILTDTKLREELIKRGLARIQLFSWRLMAKQVLETYEEVLSQ